MMRHDYLANQRQAVLYARVSSDEQEKEGFSIPAQQKLLRNYAAENGILIVEEYVDVETAKAAGRTGFNDMVEFFERQSKIKDADRRCRTILVEKTDRLYRNLKDYVTLDELGVDIHFVKENVVLSPDSHSSERFMHGIKVLMARQYVDNLSEEVKKGMLEKAEQGIWPSKAPMGYLNVEGPNGKKVVIPDPEVGPIIKRMFERYATGNMSLEDVGLLAMEEGLPLKREGNFRTVVQYTLKNPFYYGDFLFKKKLYKGIHEGLVSRECWDKVQDVREDRRAKKTRKSKKRKSFAFSRLISCGHCGCSLVGELKKGKYVYYHCTYYRGRCDEPYVREEVLEEKFTEILRQLHFDDEVLDWMRRALRESQADEQRYREEAVQPPRASRWQFLFAANHGRSKYHVLHRLRRKAADFGSGSTPRDGPKTKETPCSVAATH
jgi:DNA invertase Pin-like site-specific DNA recombinase